MALCGEKAICLFSEEIRISFLVSLSGKIQLKLLLVELPKYGMDRQLERCIQYLFVEHFLENCQYK
jgi:hypothetical protein